VRGNTSNELKQNEKGKNLNLPFRLINIRVMKVVGKCENRIGVCEIVRRGRELKRWQWLASLTHFLYFFPLLTRNSPPSFITL